MIKSFFPLLLVMLYLAAMLFKNINYQGTLSSLLMGPTIVFVVITVILAIIFYSVWDVNMWEGWTLGSNGTNTIFCEQNHLTEFIRQRANTWSNLAYLFYGLICAKLALHDKASKPQANFITRNPTISWVFAFTFVYLSFGSFFFHASITRIGQQFDMGGTYALVAFPVLVNLSRIYRHYKAISDTRLAQITIFAAIVVFGLLFGLKWHINSSAALPALIAGVLVSTLWYHGTSKAPCQIWFGALAMLSMTTAFFIWWQDVTKNWCDPESLIQGHAFWHVLTGLGGFFVYLMLRSEKTTAPPAQG
jgi:hypothetical protein